MAIYNQLPAHITEVDVIIAGGGTAACIVASRLSDANPNLSVLVVEGGRNNADDPTVINPLLFLSHLAPSSNATLFYQGTAEAQLGGRQLVVPSGGILGGGSSINLDLETYHGPGSKGTHGSNGPIQITGGTYRANRSENDFIQAAKKVGYPEIVDLQDLDSNNGVQRALQDGEHPNLNLLIESQVLRVLFQGKRASGIEYQPNPAFQSDTTKRSVNARKMVIVSAGALGTPLILERSGLGDPQILNRASVPIVADVPGVGKEYQDHHLLAYPYQTSLYPNETADAVTGGRLDVAELNATKAKILGWNAQDVTAKLRPTDAEVSELGPEFKTAWDRDYKNNANKPLVLMALLSGFPGDPSGLPVGQYLSVSNFSVYPYSRGHIHITGTNPSDPIDFQTGFFLDPVDITKHVWAYKKQREIVRRMDTYRGELAIGHPPFPSGSAAACITIDKPLRNVTDIKYTADDDEVIKKWLIANVGSTWHSLGTCKMAPFEDGGVVDPSLSVYGVTGLKIADLSIPPGNVAANTADTAYAIGEKAADIFIKELRL